MNRETETNRESRKLAARRAGLVLVVVLGFLCLLVAFLFFGFLSAVPAFRQVFASLGSDLPLLTQIAVEFAPASKILLSIAWAGQLALTMLALITRGRAVSHGALVVALLNSVSGVTLLGSMYLPLLFINTVV